MGIYAYWASATAGEVAQLRDQQIEGVALKAWMKGMPVDSAAALGSTEVDEAFRTIFEWRRANAVFEHGLDIINGRVVFDVGKRWSALQDAVVDPDDGDWEHAPGALEAGATDILGGDPLGRIHGDEVMWVAPDAVAEAARRLSRIIVSDSSLADAHRIVTLGFARAAELGHGVANYVEY